MPRIPPPSPGPLLLLLLPVGLALPSPADAATLSGTVRASDSGEGLAGAIVVAYDRRLDYEYTETDVDGRFVLSDLPAGAWRVRVLPASTDNRVPRFYPATRDYCAAEVVEITEAGSRSDVDLDLSTGATLRGRLVDLDGAAIAGGLVTAWGTDEAQANQVRSAATDADGDFTLTGLDVTADGSTSWQLELQAEGWPDQWLVDGSAPNAYDQEAGDVLSVSAGDDRALGALSLLDGIAIGGLVQGPDGPVAEALVYAYADGQLISVMTGEDGRYDAVGLPPGEVLVWASAGGIATTYHPSSDRPDSFVPVLDEGAVTDLDITAPAAATLAVQFTDAGSGDVRGMLYNDDYTVGKGTSTDADGVLNLTGLHPGAYTLFAWGSGAEQVNRWVPEEDGLPVPIELSEGEEATLDVSLEPGARVEGTILDEEGRGVYGAGVTLSPVGGEDGWSTVTDRDGRFSLGGLPAGEWVVQAAYGPYCSQDPDHVTMVWPGSPNVDDAEPLSLAQGELRDGLSLTLPSDDDHDGMGDRWEEEYGLDPLRDDSGEDPDEDGWTNREEYLLGTDPFDADPRAGQGCGCATTTPSRAPGGLGGLGGLGLLLLGLVGLRRRRR